MQLWDLDSGRREARLDSPGSAEPECLQSTPDGTRIVSGDTDNAVRIWDAASGRLLRSLLGHISPVKALAITSDGRTLASASADGTCRLWSLATGREFMTFSRGQAFTQLAFLPAGDRLVGLTTTGQLWLWAAKPSL